jgi:hypothetical protein
MGIKAINFKFNGLTTPISSYDANKTNLGQNIRQYSGSTNEDNFAGPSIIGIARPMEASVAIPSIYPHVIHYSETIDWVFLADNATAAATRRIVFYEYNKLTSEFTWKGFITLTYPSTTAHTIRGFRMVRELYTVGTVGVSGTAVTGSGSAWNTSRLSVGTRIGFGSTDPTQITTWYEISAIGSDTSITLTSSAGTISAGIPYVIEEMMAVTSTTNATTTNGGLFVTKGIRPEIFTTVGTTIPAATTVDRIRAVYWLSDAATTTNITACGSAIEDRTSWTEHNVYVINGGGGTASRIFKYNIRTALTLAAGKDNTSLVLQTGNQTVTGNLSQANNSRVVLASHGPGSGVLSLYYVTASRIYRSAISDITAGSTTFHNDVMLEIPPGGVTTYAATGVLSSIEYAPSIDRFFIMTTGAAGVRSYCTRYNTISTPMDHIFLVDDKQLDASISDSSAVIHPAILALPFSVWAEGGILYLARIGTTNLNNQIYSLPIRTHRTYAFGNNELLVTPKFDISDSNKLYCASIKSISTLGDSTFGLSTEPYNVFYRTSGISDNTGSWSELDDYGDLSSITASEIQFALTFRVIGTTCIPARIMGLTLVYEDNTTDSHYEPSVANSSVTNRIFAYRQSTLWSSAIPNMRIRLYNASSGALVLDDDVISSGFGVFEYSIDDGSSWLTWNSSADAVGNYIRYTATSLPSGIRVRSLLTQA